MIQRKYNWRPQLPDFRDFFLPRLFSDPVNQTLPSAISLRNEVQQIYDQGDTGSCTANSLAQLMRITQVKEQLKDIPPSRMFIYYNERLIEGDPQVDAGADLRDGMKVISDLGGGIETDWPFSPTIMYTKPSPIVYQNAVQNMVKSYVAVPQTLIDLKKSIADGYPFVFGFSVYQSFESQQVAVTGIMPMPAVSEKQLGGHAVCCVGYNDNTQSFEICNSWGDNWGDHGFFHMPYSYMLNENLCSDFWTITMLEKQTARKWAIPK